ncbi:hypothetical protein FP435_00420 (plasmid) [Lactobacillus sp. PV037]|uniref:hypothetical protein n=1 Tax=Lactobacillus sp. PV037 TaxID=2594496 RepID=UPI00224047B6|nr:hypothetical protein [Lactobacillus sp. PV037]QNQ83001.1 hypothetical protein FP435_00420 [Lactobacillus sp. PV037]
MNKYNQWNKTYKHLALVLLFLSVLLIIVIFLLQNPRHALENQEVQLKQNQKIINNNISLKQKRLNLEQANKVLNSENPKIRLSAKQVVANQLSSETVNKLFPILLTYSSTKEYNDRANLASKYVAKSVLKNTTMFASQKDDGTNYINTSGLHSKFDKAQTSSGTINEKDYTVPITILANYKAWFSNSPRSRLANVYSGLYNYHLRKFITLENISNVETTVAK